MANSGNKKILRIDEIENYLSDKYEIRINVITNTIEKRLKNTTESFEPVNENDLKYELLKAGHTRFDGELKALLGSSVIAKYDPLREYFEGLPHWDSSQPDYIQQLSTYVKTDDQKWFELMFKKMLVRVVAQALNKIQFNKHCFTFVGNQHDGKTSFFDFLIPTQLKPYSRSNYDFHGGREGKISLSQNFIINLDELGQYEKKDLNNEFKATLSEGYVKLRPLYSNNEVSIPRRASFVATTNSREFLTDATGSVRWIIFNVLSIQHDNGEQNGYNKNVDIEKVWSQAYSLLKDGFKCELTRDEINQNEILNRRFLRVTTEMELVASHFEKAEKGQAGAEFYTPSKIEKLLRDKGFPKLLPTQIGAALKMLGFPQSSMWNGALRYSEKGYFLIAK
ncbi:VapE domain-containing protein [Runella zeae]|uniref:VapE domain-containing protein n=1 Tax=Runella zeae TaxID=94255 RepID=UPI002352E061|nr:VapE domain-containing protein [Runella zeae]